MLFAYIIVPQQKFLFFADANVNQHKNKLPVLIVFYDVLFPFLLTNLVHA